MAVREPTTDYRLREQTMVDATKLKFQTCELKTLPADDFRGGGLAGLHLQEMSLQGVCPQHHLVGGPKLVTGGGTAGDGSTQHLGKLKLPIKAKVIVRGT